MIITITFDPSQNPIGQLNLLNVVSSMDHFIFLFNASRISQSQPPTLNPKTPLRTVNSLTPPIQQDSSRLLGTQVYVSTNKINNGSTDLFSVITTEQTMVPVSFPNTIGVMVNGIPSSCSDPSSCTFSYSEVNQSTVTSISPSSIVFGNQSSVDVGIYGSFLNADIGNTKVTIGGADCTVTSVTTSLITCTLGNNAKAGSQQVLVNISPFGLAAPSAPLGSKAKGGRTLLASSTNVTVKVLYVGSVTPSVLYARGWTTLNITAKGIDYSNCSNNVVTIGGIQCAIVSCVPGALTAVFPGSSANPSASVVVAVLDPSTGQRLDSSTWSGSAVVSEDGTVAPCITAMVSSPSSGAGGVVSATLGGALDPRTITRTALVPAVLISAGFPAFSQAFASQ